MMQSNHLTIITIVKNYSDGLNRTVQSVRSQIVDDSFTFVHIFCDGGSEPSEVASILEIISDDSKMISRIDSGIYSGMNKGLNKVDSGWILFLNAGDTFLAKDSLQRVMRILDKSETGFFQFKSRYDDGFDRPVKPYTWLSLYLGFSMHAHPSLFLRREFFDKISFDEKYRIAGDFKFVLEAMKIRDLEFSNLPVTRFEGDGISSRQVDRMIEEMNQIRLDLKPFLIPKILIKIWNLWAGYRNRYLRGKLVNTE